MTVELIESELGTRPKCEGVEKGQLRSQESTSECQRLDPTGNERLPEHSAGLRKERELDVLVRSCYKSCHSGSGGN